MGKISFEGLPVRTGSIYPEPFAAMMKGRTSLRLGDAGGLTQFGANLVTLAPGALSSLRHWHRNEDEFVMVTEGAVVLVQDEGETEMHPGDCAAFPAGVENGHQFRNDGDTKARFLVVGTRAPHEEAIYSDHDLKVVIGPGSATFTRKDGSPLPDQTKGENEND